MGVYRGRSAEQSGSGIIYHSLRDELEAALERFFRIMFPVGLGLGGVALGVSMVESARWGWYPTLVVNLGIYLTAVMVFVLRQRVPARRMLIILLGLLALSATQSFCSMGLAGKGLMTLTVLCTFTGVFLGIRAGMIAVAASTVVTLLFGAGICSGVIITKPDVVGYITAPNAWFVQATCFLVYIIPLILATNGMQERMGASLARLKEMNEMLQSEVSMRAMAEKELRESEEKYRNIFEHAVEGIFQTTLHGELKGVNPSLARMAGFGSPVELMESEWNKGQRFWIRSEDRSKLKTLLETRGSAEGVEVEMKRRDGTALWISMNVRAVLDGEGEISLFEGSALDITKRKTAEIRLHESEAKYRSVVESSLVASYIVQDNRFRFVNTRFSDLTAYRYDEIVDKMSPMDLVHQDDRDRLKADFMKRTDWGREESEHEVKAVRKDGKIITVKLLGSQFIYNGRPAAFGTLVDITKEVNLESQLRQSQKMEAIGTLAGGIAHDFNNILTALTGYGTLLQMKMEKADPLRLYADQILSASQKAASLTQSLLAFGRRQPITLKPQNLNLMIMGTEKLLKRLITEDITLTTDLVPEEVVVMADATQIDQILFNLVTNAADAMPKGGVIEITTDMVSLDREFVLAHGFGEVGQYALLAVSDTGGGMDKATREKIFDPFFTTKDVGKGTGLGLSTVYGIVKQHNGYITVSSEPGMGTVFSIYLPLVKTVISTDVPLPVPIERGSETILVAEDNREVRCLVKDVLGQYGYTVIEAMDGDDAVARFRENEEISLVVIDSVMPKKNGREAYDAMRGLRPGIPALFMSGYTTDIVLGKGVEEQRFDFIPKPLSPHDLLEKVRSILDRGR